MISLQLSEYEKVSVQDDNNDDGNDSDSEQGLILKAFTPHLDINYEIQGPELDRESTQAQSGSISHTSFVFIPKNPFLFSIYLRFIQFIKVLIIICIILYLVFLSLLFSSASIEKIKYLFQIQTHSNPTRNSCEFSADNIKSKINVHLLINVLNWICYTLAIRNWKLLLISSVLWEMMSFILIQYCWFQVFVFHVLGTNLFGIGLGLLILKIIKINSYYSDWFLSYKNLMKCNKSWFKYLAVSLMLTLVVPITEILGHRIFEYVTDIGIYHYLYYLRCLLYLMVIIGCFNQLYLWMFMEYYAIRKIIQETYWIILLWTMILFEIVACLIHYL